MSNEGGPALFRLVRYWSRRWARGVATDVGHAAAVPQHVLVVDAVDTLHRRDCEATVGELAQQLGLDHSNASRMTRPQPVRASSSGSEPRPTDAAPRSP